MHVISPKISPFPVPPRALHGRRGTTGLHALPRDAIHDVQESRRSRIGRENRVAIRDARREGDDHVDQAATTGIVRVRSVGILRGKWP